MLSRTLVFAKGAGVTGIRLLQTQPLLLLVLPTVGGMFFHGCGSVLGNNTVGRICNTLGDGLNLPMFYAEMLYNSYAAPVLYKTTGIQTLLNYTKQAQRGPGLDAKEALELLNDSGKESISKKVQSYIVKRFTDLYKFYK